MGQFFMLFLLAQIAWTLSILDFGLRKLSKDWAFEVKMLRKSSTLWQDANAVVDFSQRHDIMTVTQF